MDTKWIMIMAFTMNGALHEQPIGLFDTQQQCLDAIAESKQITNLNSNDVEYRCVPQGTEI